MNTAAQRPRVLSAMKPSSQSLHLGNYLGAAVEWVRLQETSDAFFCVADLHAITVPQDPKALAQNTRIVAAQYLACGVDPEQSCVFVQSHVPQHAELSWVLSCVTAFGEASRMTQFKDKSAKAGNDLVSVGLFTYPILMAADILLYRPQSVPVGDDQRQHLELTRDIANRFNTTYGDTFTVPQGLSPQRAIRIMDLQNPQSKMSKSAESPNGLIELLDDPKVITKRIKSAVTDNDREIRLDWDTKPGVSNLLQMHSLLTGESIADVAAGYAGKGYGDLKGQVAELVVNALTPVRERFEELMADPVGLDAVLAAGAERARSVAAATLDDVYSRVGFLAPGQR